jgi:hypothetical protein
MKPTPTSIIPGVIDGGTNDDDNQGNGDEKLDDIGSTHAATATTTTTTTHAVAVADTSPFPEPAAPVAAVTTPTMTSMATADSSSSTTTTATTTVAAAASTTATTSTNTKSSFQPFELPRLTSIENVIMYFQCILSMAHHDTNKIFMLSATIVTSSVEGVSLYQQLERDLSNSLPSILIPYWSMEQNSSFGAGLSNSSVAAITATLYVQVATIYLSTLLSNTCYNTTLTKDNIPGVAQRVANTSLIDNNHFHNNYRTYDLSSSTTNNAIMDTIIEVSRHISTFCCCCCCCWFG